MGRKLSGRLGRLEWIFVGVSLFLSCFAAFLFFFQAERLGVWLGLLVESEQKPIGKLEYSTATTQRKSLNSQRFFAINNQQKVFDRDTILTGENTEAVISLSDGGSINIGPNSLVELRFRESNPLDSNSEELVLDVQKGAVSGVGGMSKIKVTQDKKTIAIPTIEKNTLLSNVMTTKHKEDLNVHCEARLSDFTTAPPKVMPEGGMEVSVDLDCGGSFVGSNRVTIQDAAHHVLLDHQAFQFESGVVKQEKLRVPAPGVYAVKWEKDSKENKPLLIPDTWTGIVFESDRPDCNGTLHFKLSHAPAAGITPTFTTEINGVAATSPQTSPGPDANSVVLGDIPYPTKVRIKSTPDKNGFSFVSAMLSLQTKRVCNQLTYPKNSEAVKTKAGSPLLFTWKHYEGQTNVRFELASDKRFQTIIKREETIRNFMRVFLSTKGTYYWRVIDLKNGENSDVYEFRIP